MKSTSLPKLGEEGLCSEERSSGHILWNWVWTYCHYWYLWMELFSPTAPETILNNHFNRTEIIVHREKVYSLLVSSTKVNCIKRHTHPHIDKSQTAWRGRSDGHAKQGSVWSKWPRGFLAYIPLYLPVAGSRPTQITCNLMYFPTSYFFLYVWLPPG